MTSSRPTSDTWIFPFDEPLAPDAGDNQALAVNTTDETAAYSVAFALVWADGEEPLTNTNEAYAAASCQRCAAVAVAFQVVLVVGEADVAVPQNTAVSVNYDCTSCLTFSAAVQLFVTLDGPLSAESTAEIERIWADAVTFGQEIGSVPLDQIRAELTAFEQQIVAVIEAEQGPLVPGSEPGSESGSPSPGASPSGSPTGSPTSSPTGSPTQSPSGSPTSSSSAGSSSSPGSSTSPSSSPSTSPSSSPSPSSGVLEPVGECLVQPVEEPVEQRVADRVVLGVRVTLGQRHALSGTARDDDGPPPRRRRTPQGWGPVVSGLDRSEHQEEQDDDGDDESGDGDGASVHGSSW